MDGIANVLITCINNFILCCFWMAIAAVSLVFIVSVFYVFKDALAEKIINSIKTALDKFNNWLIKINKPI